MANAQAAYFAFANFLAWSTQPIYVLEKDNDLTVAQLAQKNAADILTVQPAGPFLLGGHSYGAFKACPINASQHCAGFPDYQLALTVLAMSSQQLPLQKAF